MARAIRGWPGSATRPEHLSYQSPTPFIIPFVLLFVSISSGGVWARRGGSLTMAGSRTALRAIVKRKLVLGCVFQPQKNPFKRLSGSFDGSEG